jgi:hypothetical protein
MFRVADIEEIDEVSFGGVCFSHFMMKQKL